MSRNRPRPSNSAIAAAPTRFPMSLLLFHCNSPTPSRRREAPWSLSFEYYTEPHPAPDSEAHVPADEQVTRPSLQALEAERTAFHTAHSEVSAPAAPVATQHEDPENAPTWDSSARLNPNYTFVPS